jgi:hypothetical protein
MKLGKEEFQKIFLSILLLFGLMYGYFSMLLGPLDKEQANAENSISDLNPKILGATAVIKDVAAREKSAPAIAETLEQIKSAIPDGAPIAWFPPALLTFFKRQGIDKCSIHVDGETGDKEMQGFRKYNWTVSIPSVEMAPLGKAIATLENEQPLLEITILRIGALRENVQYQNVTMVVSTIVKQ